LPLTCSIRQSTSLILLFRNESILICVLLIFYIAFLLIFVDKYLNLFGSDGVVGVKENTALSADMLLCHSISNAGNSTQGTCVCSANGIRCSLQTNVTIFTPGFTPAVTEKPVVTLLWVSTVSNKLNSWRNCTKLFQFS